MDQHVCSNLQEIRLLVDVAPKVNPGAYARPACLLKDSFTCRQKVGMVVLLGHTEAARKIVRADKHAIQPRYGEYLIQRLYCGNAFNVNDEQLIFFSIV